MALKTHYDNLQIARNASPEVVRAAYRGLSQKWHPDRNPPESRPECERIMKILNAAYEVLSDAEARARHDRWIAEQERQPPPRAAAAPREAGPEPAPPNFDFTDSRLQPGTIRWADARGAARTEVAMALANRHPGYACAPIARLSTQLCIAAAGAIVAAGVGFWSARTPWSGNLALFAFCAVAAASLLIVYGLLRCYQMLASGCGRRIAVTPTHLIECDYATLTVWPLLGTRRFDSTHQHLNGTYSGTDIRFEHIAGGSRSFILRSKPAAERLQGTLADNVWRAQQAGIAYVGEIKNSALYWQPKGALAYADNGAPAIGIATLIGTVMLSAALFFGVLAPLNDKAAERAGGRPHRPGAHDILPERSASLGGAAAGDRIA